MNLNYVMYTILFLFGIWVFYLDAKDWQCENILAQSDPNCVSNPLAFPNTKPNENDTIKKSIYRIRDANDVYTTTILWRRTAFLSMVICFALFFLLITPGKLPNWQTFYLSFFIVYTLFYFQQAYYNHHYFSIPAKHTEQNLQNIENRLGLC